MRVSTASPYLILCHLYDIIIIMKSDESKESKKSKTPKETKTAQHAGRYLIVGIILTIFNYGVYTILANVIFNNPNLLWLCTLIATTLTTFLAFLLHSKITWKEREVSKTAIYKFFVWNFLAAFLIGPGLTQLFSLITPLYEFAFNICQNMHIDFTYEFVLSTGTFVLTNAVLMVLNFLFYDKFVFGKANKELTEEK